MSGNREYKSDVFSMLMEDRDNALQLYNALNDSAYTDADMVEIRTLDKGVSLSIRNDCAFVVDSNLSVYEHQSTICPNMPVRCLIYFSNIIEKIIKKHNIYGKTLVKLPTPHFAVFYNGLEEMPEQYDLNLSDAFSHKSEKPELELTCRVYNINYGKNKKLLEACPVLKEYMIFVDYVRENYKEQEYENLELAINRAIDRCIRENVLKNFLMENRSEVVKVTQLDYTFDRQIELEREDARREGREEGIREGREEGIKEGQKEGELKILIKQICKKHEKGYGIMQISEMLEEDEQLVSQIYQIVEKCAPEYDVDSILA